MNHAIDVKLSSDKSGAQIQLQQQNDKRLVPHKDFVLYLKDDSMNKPVGLVNMCADGD